MPPGWAVLTCLASLTLGGLSQRVAQKPLVMTDRVSLSRQAAACASLLMAWLPWRAFLQSQVQQVSNHTRMEVSWNPTRTMPGASQRVQMRNAKRKGQCQTQSKCQVHSPATSLALSSQAGGIRSEPRHAQLPQGSQALVFALRYLRC